MLLVSGPRGVVLLVLLFIVTASVRPWKPRGRMRVRVHSPPLLPAHGRRCPPPSASPERLRASSSTISRFAVSSQSACHDSSDSHSCTKWWKLWWPSITSPFWTDCIPTLLTEPMEPPRRVIQRYVSTYFFSYRDYYALFFHFSTLPLLHTYIVIYMCTFIRAFIPFPRFSGFLFHSFYIFVVLFFWSK